MPPPRSLAQRDDALRRANAIRRQRAQLKQDLKAGRRTIDDVLSDPPAFVQTAKVADLLLAVPRYGPVKVNKLLARCRIRAVQDDRRTLTPPARRAHRAPGQLKPGAQVPVRRLAR